MTLRELRISKGLHQKDVASKLGVNKSTLWRWENEPSKIKVDYVKKMQKIYKISFKELLNITNV